MRLKARAGPRVAFKPTKLFAQPILSTTLLPSFRLVSPPSRNTAQTAAAASLQRTNQRASGRRRRCRERGSGGGRRTSGRRTAGNRACPRRRSRGSSRPSRLNSAASSPSRTSTTPMLTRPQVLQLDHRWSAQSPVLLPDLTLCSWWWCGDDCCTGGAPKKQDDGLRKNKLATDKAKDKVVPG